MKTIIKSYMKIWIWVYLMAFLIPATSIYKTISKFFALGLVIFFLTIITLSMMLTYSFLTKKKIINECRIPLINNKLIFSVIKICSLLSIAGLFCFIYDKVLIQGVNYSDGLAIARNDFRDIGENRNGISSMYSVFGYVLSGFSCISLLLSFIFFELNKKLTLFGILTSILNLMGISFLTGGRTSIILIVVTIMAGKIIRSFLNYTQWPFSKKVSGLFIFLSLVMFFYTIYIFADRAQSGDTLIKDYTELMIEHLSGKTTINFEKIELLPEFIQTFIFLCLALITYFVHGTWITEGIFEIKIKYGQATFLGFGDYFAKIGLPTKPNEWFFSGKFVTWPGAIFYDLGIFGIIIIALIQGILFGYCTYKIQYCKQLTISTLFLFFFNFSIIITSPFICVIDLLMYTPMCLAFSLLIIGMSLLKNKKITYLNV